MNDYAFAVQCPQCGQDTAIEQDGGLNLVALAPGMAFGDVKASREGNDLFLATGNSQNGLVLQDYYSGGQDWRLRTASGDTESVADLLAAGTADRLQQVWQSYQADFKSDFYNGIAYDGSGARVDACFTRKAKVRAFTAGRPA